jgi:hypothetical protein
MDGATTHEARLDDTVEGVLAQMQQRVRATELRDDEALRVGRWISVTVDRIMGLGDDLPRLCEESGDGALPGGKPDSGQHDAPPDHRFVALYRHGVGGSLTWGVHGETDCRLHSFATDTSSLDDVTIKSVGVTGREPARRPLVIRVAPREGSAPELRPGRRPGVVVRQR